MEKQTVAELKDMCRSRGLRVGGTKRDLIARLAGEEAQQATASAASMMLLAPPLAGVVDPGDVPTAAPAKRPRTSGGGRPTARNIGQLLAAAGWGGDKTWSKCAASAIAKGHLRWTGAAAELDQPAVLASGSLLECRALPDDECKHAWNPTLRSLLEQTDTPGLDYECGLRQATVRCTHEGCNNPIYLSFMCAGKFQIDSGKFHNHCTECKGLGKCMGDYRMEHCYSCGNHYFSGLSGFACDRCGGSD